MLLNVHHMSLNQQNRKRGRERERVRVCATKEEMKKVREGSQGSDARLTTEQKREREEWIERERECVCVFECPRASVRERRERYIFWF